MKDENVHMLNNIIVQNTKKLGWKVIRPRRSDNIISILKEEWHLFIDIQNPIVSSLSLQMAIYIEENALRMLLFPSPCIPQVDELGIISLVNVANRYLFRGNALGRFWYDNSDFAYELILKEEMVEKFSDEVSKQIFTVPCLHFMDLHIPLVMLAKNSWDAGTAIEYFTELREKGYVDNNIYELL